MESEEGEQDLAGSPEAEQGRAGGGITYTSCSSQPRSGVGHDEPGWVGDAGQRLGLGAGPAGRSFTRRGNGHGSGLQRRLLQARLCFADFSDGCPTPWFPASKSEGHPKL